MTKNDFAHLREIYRPLKAVLDSEGKDDSEWDCYRLKKLQEALFSLNVLVNEMTKDFEEKK